MQLSEDVRWAFILRHHEERSIEEISQILAVNPNTVKNRIFRAVSRLREILSPKVGEYD
jgi:RNA polymerase sigma-70 factor (ECF subfamily)